MIDLLTGLALAVAGVALGALKPDLSELTAGRRLWKAARVLLVGAGVALALGILHLPFGGEAAPAIAWRSDVETALAEAKAAGKPALLDGGATWCGACKELEHKTFTDPDVAAALAGFVAIRLDMTAFDAAQARLAALGIQVGSLPWVGFFLPDGRLNPGVTLTDFEPPRPFLKRIAQAGTWREAPLSPIESWLGEGGLLLALVLVFVAGIGVSLTPCVYPMIPITISVIGGGGFGPTATPVPFGSRVVRSAVFVAGMVVAYTVLGVVSALVGKGFGSWLQSPAVTLGMTALFAAMAASYLGFFQLRLPASLTTAMGRNRGGVLGIALAGAAAGIVAAPCAGPVVVGILAVISGTGDLLLGMVLMVTFALGMGLLFFALGLSTALIARRPRQGAWMERVEVVFAIALVVVSIYYGKLGIEALLA